ncbi:potassium transporter Kup [Uliginosibacterium gangwonense]|uniref:potassium transporter Kup n=1 Tax=Uliginosibacterium gangwonense TaxID=392736 RepID=UPI00047739F9|nr:potassium transporter Kup [Uliginosibacterium gangwonense]
MSQSHAGGATSPRMSTLMLAALGVVYGDIGTSPLYALKEAFAAGHHPLAATAPNILGVLSLITWSLLIIVTFKYVTIVLRADNQGEGGVVALMARVVSRAAGSPQRKATAIALGIFGASLFYGDGIITPAISVLSAVEGLEVATPAFQPYIVPITMGILIGLFLFQHHGTARVGSFFGPFVVIWFLCLAGIGIYNILAHPQVLGALSPHYAIRFVSENPKMAFYAMGAVFLTMTGGEALYADMGHFGPMPIRYTWLGLVLPSLLINYLGQGALMIVHPEAAANPFYLAVPGWFLFPMVGLATVATVIASQALITGAYSVTLQLIQLGFCPRMVVKHTSGAQMGQIYLPFVNWILLFFVLIVVLGFRSSSNLAAAYGIAVTLTMLVTSFLAYTLARHDWQWSRALCLAIFMPLLCIEMIFLVSNGTKILDGGWFPLAFGGCICVILFTWRRGRQLLADAQRNDDVPLAPFVTLLADDSIPRVPHTALFLSPRPEQVPTALLHNLKHNLILHERTVFVSVLMETVPRVPVEDRVEVAHLGTNFHRVLIRFGFMEEPDVPAALLRCESLGLVLDAQQASYFLSRETILPSAGTGMALWRERLFEFLFRNASGAANFFKLPTSRVVELGSRVMI